MTAGSNPFGIGETTVGGVVDQSVAAIVTADKQGGVVNYKSQLQELLQARGQPPPVYCLVKASGPDHDRRFIVEVRAGNTALGRGSGKSKKQAETRAAHSALEHFLS